MKCRLLIDCKGPGPNWGKVIDNGTKSRDQITKPAGTIIDNPAAWKLCFCFESYDSEGKPTGPLLAEPADEECEQRVQLNKEKVRLTEVQLARDVAKAREDRDREQVEREKADTDDFGDFLNLSDDEFDTTVKQISDGDD
jgi:hypothetical protein